MKSSTTFWRQFSSMNLKFLFNSIITVNNFISRKFSQKIININAEVWANRITPLIKCSNSTDHVMNLNIVYSTIVDTPYLVFMK